MYSGQFYAENISGLLEALGRLASCYKGGPCLPTCTFVLTDDVDVKRQSCFCQIYVSRAQCQRTEKILSYKLMFFSLRKHPGVFSLIYIVMMNAVFAPLALISSFTKWLQEIILWKRVCRVSHPKVGMCCTACLHTSGHHGGFIHHFIPVLKTEWTACFSLQPGPGISRGVVGRGVSS